jgi:hypothetical protein
MKMGHNTVMPLGYHEMVIAPHHGEVADERSGADKSSDRRGHVEEADGRGEDFIDTFVLGALSDEASLGFPNQPHEVSIFTCHTAPWLQPSD